MAKIKIIFPGLVLVIFFVLILTAAWFTSAKIIFEENAKTISLYGINLPFGYLLLSYLLILISAIFYSLIVLIERKFILIVIGAFAGIILSLPIIFAKPTFYIAAVVPGLALLVFSAWRTRQIMKDLLPWRPSWGLHAGLPLYFLGLNILLTAAVVSSPLAESFFAQPIPKDLMNIGLSYVQEPLEKFAGININSTVDQTINKLNEGQLNDPRLLAKARAEYSKSFGLSLSGKESVKDIIFEIVNREINKLKVKIGALFEVFFAISTFFTFQFIAWPAKIAVNLVTRLMLFIFEAASFIVVEDKAARKYVVRWKSSPSEV